MTQQFPNCYSTKETLVPEKQETGARTVIEWWLPAAKLRNNANVQLHCQILGSIADNHIKAIWLILIHNTEKVPKIACNMQTVFKNN
jgi:hypothetical protein